MSSIYRSCSPRRVAAPMLVARTLVARVVYLHLLVGELAGQVPGIVRAGAGAIAEEVNLDVSDVRAALAELELFGLADVDQAARLIRLPGVAEDAARLAATPNVVVGWARVLAELPECAVRARHAETLRDLVREDQRGLFEPMAKGLGTLSRGPANPSETHPKQDRDSSRTPTAGEQEQPRAEPLALTPVASTQKPPRARRPDPSASKDVCKVWLAYQDLRIKLELQKPDDRPEAERPSPVPAQVRDITRAVGAAGGVDSFLVVLRRAAEDQLRQAERAGVSVRDNHDAASRHFVIVTLGRQAGRYLEQPDLDHRRPATPARASPARPSRPAPPHHPGSLPPSITSDFEDGE